MKELKMDLGPNRGYTIRLEAGGLSRLSQYVNLQRKVLVVTDDGVPSQYAGQVCSQCGEGSVLTLPQGEATKSFEGLQQVLKTLQDKNFHRQDLIVAVGGGVVGDLAGLAASLYMRGIDFVNLPTTTLSQVDSSIGGKTAINFCGVKNSVGSFYQPKFVLIDPQTLTTLSRRHYFAGLVEALKAGLLADPELFSLFEKGNFQNALEEILLRSLRVKQEIVSQDERETDRRRLLNLGHTLGHGYEAAAGLGGLYHGECVALGMLPMIASPALRQRTVKILKAMGIPTQVDLDRELILQAALHDKKADDQGIWIVWIEDLGVPRMRRVTAQELRRMLP